MAIALSGGADSVALTSLMRDLAPSRALPLPGSFISIISFASRLPMTSGSARAGHVVVAAIEVGHADVKERSRCDRISIEEAVITHATSSSTEPGWRSGPIVSPRRTHVTTRPRPS